ncbi:MAG: hypothetical protein PHU25_04780 [Deltaproteobacteria bacterium]|nr:hypothetical protein [Deltaproteobacteria bacterium]
MRVEVVCYSGYRGEETPRALVVGERRLEVKEVLGRWREPDRRYFELLCADGATYLMSHDEEHDLWELSRREPA